MHNEQTKKIGFLGLGNMGKNMVMNLLDHGYEVYAWNRSEQPRIESAEAGAKVFESISDLIAALGDEPKVIWSMVAAGEPVDLVIDQLITGENSLKEGDILVDGVNSHYKDTLRRSEKLSELGIKYLDCGVSGGIKGARSGACIMVGGDQDAFTQIEPIIKDLSQENGYGYFGSSGAGHYVKMIHNAIEYGMMQAIAEGINLLDASPYQVDYKKLTEVWNHGSIIESNLIGFLNSAFSEQHNLPDISSEIGSLGTGKWAVEESLDRGISMTSIANAVAARYESRETDTFAHKIISALREEFGAHNSQERPN
ncbi:decarboxylating 6-phosphogluconate dehydrogenase [Candidatus Dojkabacteria bacterium]|uniref:Decarboxylating 6-phosphogluconate dehydrogenase n=1 Tax=Candidatus Dojkabacteria bacterium TaxID=2099670 RepID=A0A955L715_9BACT|nr:decarboxylating 6-phosphogluconate dehydrogenase [Candidatus Dojkabacteria bacterium]